MTGARRGVILAALEQYAGLILNFLTVVAVSRFLGPAETGAGVIGLSIAAIVFSLREFASPDVLIKQDTVRDVDVQTAFTYLLGVSLLLALLLFLARSSFAAAYRDAGLVAFLNVAILASLIETISLPSVALLRRQMAFGILARIRTAGTALGALAAVVTAYLGFGHMCFAYGMLASAVVTTVMSFTAYPAALLMRPTLKSLPQMWRFGLYLGSNAAVNKICETFPQLILGRFMPVAAVGIYNRSNTVSGLPDRIILSAVFTVAFPMLSAQVRQNADLKASYIKALSYISVVYWPAQLVLACLAYPAVHIILGSGWQEAVPIVMISCIASMFWFPVVLTYPLLLAMGKNRDAFLSNLTGRTVATLIVCLAAYHGLITLALSLFISIPFQMAVAIHYVNKHVHFSYRKLAFALLRSAIVALAAAIPPLCALAWQQFSPQMDWPEALIVGTASILCWLIALYLVRHPFTEEVTHAVSHLLARLPYNAVRRAGRDA